MIPVGYMYKKVLRESASASIEAGATDPQRPNRTHTNGLPRVVRGHVTLVPGGAVLMGRNEFPCLCVNYETQRFRESTYDVVFSLDWHPSPMVGSFLRSAGRSTLRALHRWPSRAFVHLFVRCQPVQKKTYVVLSNLAEGVGFEPTVPLQARRFSRPVP
jgi:hypothetical protein